MQSGPGAPLTSEAGGPGCLAVLVPKSRPNTSRDFLKPPRSSEGSAGASSDADARSGTSAAPTCRGEAGGWDGRRGRRRAPADPDPEPELRMVWAGPGRSRGVLGEHPQHRADVMRTEMLRAHRRQGRSRGAQGLGPHASWPGSCWLCCAGQGEQVSQAPLGPPGPPGHRSPAALTSLSELGCTTSQVWKSTS